MKIGSSDISAAYIGSTAINKVYIGSTEVWSSYAYLLDDYSGAAAAYSLRQLRSAYTGSAIRVRRASDNTEQNIGFVNNELDTTSLASFCSGTNGFVTTWYDQSGNGYNATQTTAASQPQIVSSGSVVTKNGKPTIDFLTTKALSTSTDINFISGSFVYEFANASNNNMLTTNYPSSNDYYIFYNSTTISYDGAVNDEARFSLNGSSLSSYAENHSGTFSANTQYHNYFNYDTSRSMKSVFRSIGNYNGFAFDYQGKIQEMVMWNSDNSSDLNGINTNINDFYSIY